MREFEGNPLALSCSLLICVLPFLLFSIQQWHIKQVLGAHKDPFSGNGDDDDDDDDLYDF
jgi:hypothetical protein